MLTNVDQCWPINSGQCSALAIMFVLPLRHTHIIFKNQVCAGGSKIGRVVQSPKIQISIASATNWSSHVPRVFSFFKRPWSRGC